MSVIVIIITLCLKQVITIRGLHRIRRQDFDNITRRNLYFQLLLARASGHPLPCEQVCGSYSENERQRAENDPLRRPSPRIRNRPIGGISFGQRFNQGFLILGTLCRSMCSSPST